MYITLFQKNSLKSFLQHFPLQGCQYLSEPFSEAVTRPWVIWWKKYFIEKTFYDPKDYKKNHFCSMYPPLASTMASNLLWAFSLIAHNISASVSSHAVIWLKCFCLKMFLWHPWLQKAYFFSIQTPFAFTMTSNV